MKLLDPNEKVLANSRTVWHESFSAMAERHPEVIALTGDLSRSICTEQFRKRAPERYFNLGIMEQNMVGMAAGLALCGKIPYCITFAPFAAMRAGEQFRTDVCYMNLNVRVVAPYGGIAWPAGPTHSGLEDAAIIRAMPGAAIVAPSDVSMIPKVFDASVTYQGPLYIRMGTGANEAVIYDGDYDFHIGKAIVAREGRDATIISFGLSLRDAVEAANLLADEGVDAGVLDMHTLKPLDAQAVLDAARRTRNIVTIEQHALTGGLGGAVSELLMESGVPCKLKRLGIPDLFPQYGDPAELAVKYGFGAGAAVAAVKELLGI